MEELRKGAMRLRNATQEISQDSTGEGMKGRERKEERHFGRRKYVWRGQENLSSQPVLRVPGNMMAPGHSLCAIGQQQKRNERDRRSRGCSASLWCWGMNVEGGVF